MSYSVHITNYDGPMELLLDLITKKKLSISDISIYEITEGFMEYIKERKKMNLDIASDFVQMASHLLEVKSRYTLYLKSKKKDEVDPREELVRQIEEYARFKDITEKISRNISYENQRYYRSTHEIFEEDIEEIDIDMEKFLSVLPSVFSLLEKHDMISEYEDIPESNLKTIVKAKVVSVESKMNRIRDLISNNEEVEFESLLDAKEKSEMIASFLSILELIKLREIHVYQSSEGIKIIRGEKKYTEEIVSEYDENLGLKAEKRLKRKIENKKSNELVEV